MLVCHQPTGSRKNVGSKKIFDAHFLMVKHFWSQIYYPSYAYSGEHSKVLFLSPLDHFLVTHVVLTFLTQQLKTRMTKNIS